MNSPGKKKLQPLFQPPPAGQPPTRRPPGRCRWDAPASARLSSPCRPFAPDLWPPGPWWMVVWIDGMGERHWPGSTVNVTVKWIRNHSQMVMNGDECWSILINVDQCWSYGDQWWIQVHHSQNEWWIVVIPPSEWRCHCSCWPRDLSITVWEWNHYILMSNKWDGTTID